VHELLVWKSAYKRFEKPSAKKPSAKKPKPLSKIQKLARALRSAGKLPKGWSVELKYRDSGTCEGHCDKYYTGPNGGKRCDGALVALWFNVVH
jgi:hypothetical protein